MQSANINSQMTKVKRNILQAITHSQHCIYRSIDLLKNHQRWCDRCSVSTEKFHTKLFHIFTLSIFHTFKLLHFQSIILSHFHFYENQITTAGVYQPKYNTIQNTELMLEIYYLRDDATLQCINRNTIQVK